MDIFLLRHAQTTPNQKGELYSTSEDSLTKAGLEQATAMVPDLLKLEIETILCSPYPRAINTITPFCEAAGKEINSSGCLAEGQLVLESSIKAQPPEYSPVNGYPIQNETKTQFIGRAKQAMELILNQSTANVLVVSHGHMIRELLNMFLDTTKKVRFPHNNCGLTYLSLKEHVLVQYTNRIIGYESQASRLSLRYPNQRS